MKRNLDTTDRVLRFLLAFWWLGPFAPVFAWNWLNIVVLIIGVIALLESFLGWCWVHHLLNIDMKRQ